jgi:hypothetical protein
MRPPFNPSGVVGQPGVPAGMIRNQVKGPEPVKSGIASLIKDENGEEKKEESKIETPNQQVM